MSDHLPARRNDEQSRSPIVNSAGNGTSRLDSVLASPIARSVAAIVPDLLRLAERNRALSPEPRSSFVSSLLPRNDGASGVTVSEVEVDVDAPFIRRVVIRSASSWSVSPEVIERQQKPRRGRLKLGAFTVGVIGLAGFVFARRLGISMPGNRLFRSRPSKMLSANTANRIPGAAD